jgi:protein unc-45
MMGLLQASVQLLYGVTPSELDDERLSKLKSYEESIKPTTAIERGIEVLSYLASKTQVKEELAHGFRASLDSPSTALERLVELACAPNAGESLSAFGLATIFALMAVSFETLRREAFAGKDITMEQYDELQALSMTKQEKSMEPSEAEDTLAAVQERIRRMANADVPRAMVKLMNGASDSTVKQIIVGLNRMASEASVRGLIVQQGALSACIKVERGVRSRFIMSVIVIVYNTLTLSFASFSQDNPSETGKNILRQARHCIAKLLVTTNPNLLTSSQQMGSIKPLIQLIRDNDSTDFQQFEALLAITNLASAGDETKEHIVAEKGISTLSYAMFSDHKMVRRAVQFGSASGHDGTSGRS